MLLSWLCAVMCTFDIYAFIDIITNNKKYTYCKIMDAHTLLYISGMSYMYLMRTIAINPWVRKEKLLVSNIKKKN